MPSERVQRRIDSLLDDAERAIESNDWDTVNDRVISVLALEPDNADAVFYREAADRATNGSTSAAVAVDSDKTTTAKSESETPTTFSDGRYLVSRLLGEGGKKMVYLAHDNVLDRDVAFGLIKTDGLDDVGRERILREAQAMGRMGTHPCIMPIYDLGEENGQPFMVQPPMAGGDVEELIEDIDGALPLEQAIKIAYQTAQCLVFAHAKGIIHRDLKPGNVWLDDNGDAKIGDFGLAIATDRSRLTVEKLMVGTVNYMPPEQATGGEVTPRADLYSLGAMLYEMSTGRVPFMGDDDIAVISQHVNTPPVAPSWHNRTIPRTLDSLILRLMSKNPDERLQTADEVIIALDAVDLSIADDSHEDQSTSLDSMAGGVFVGRHREMDQLKSIFEDVLSGRGRLVTLVGEPGIGKTRTAQELATYANMRGADVYWGRSYESGGAPSYWPWVQAIRSYVANTEPDALRNQMGSSASVIAEVVSDVREKLPDLTEPPHIDDPESARFRLFDSVATFLKQASNSTPIVLMLEDLHWSDKPSLMLLEFVARELANSKILIVGNYRDVELNRRHPLSVTLGDLTRERLFERVVLRGLQRHDVQQFIERAAGIAPPTALVDAVQTQTEGNPLFVTETVRLLIQEGDITVGKAIGGGTTSWEIRIPEGVREVIGRRLDRLSERCNDLLTLAAVIGRQFRFDILKELSEETTEGQLLDALDEALSARLVEELPEEVGFYQFTHASMQETLTEELSHTRAVRMHALIAVALEQHYGADSANHAEELVEHFAEAETVLGTEKLTKYSIIAGDAAAAALAWESAFNFYKIAIDAGPNPPTDPDTARLFARAGHALASLRRIDESIDLVGKAFDYFLDNGDYISAAEAIQVQYISGMGKVAVRPMISRVIDHVPESSALGIWLKSQLGHILSMYEGRYADGYRMIIEASEAAKTLGDPELIVKVNDDGALASFWNLEYPRAHEHIDRVLELEGVVDNPVMFAQAHGAISVKSAAEGDWSKADQESKIAIDFAKRSGDRQRVATSHWFGMRAAMERGLWESAREHADGALNAWPEDYRISARLSLLENEIGNAEAAEKILASVERSEEHPEALMGALVSIALITESSATWRQTVELIDTDWRGIHNAPSVDLTQSALEGAIRLFQGQIDQAESLYRTVRELLPPEAKEVMTIANTDLHLATYISRKLKHADDALLYVKMWYDWAKRGHKPLSIAWAAFRFSEILADRDDPSDADRITELQDEAIAIAREIGLTPLLERVLAQREILKA
jgi:tetratricopeptide (TPR) repeat protein